MSSTRAAVFSGSLGPMSVVRLAVGAFYLPHVLSKVMAFQGTTAFFAKAGFQPAEFFVVFSGALELAVALALLSGVFVKYASLLSTGLMVVAAYAILAVKGPGWYWNAGGIEYLIFWALASVAVFVDAWQKEPGLFGWLPRESTGKGKTATPRSA